MSEQQIKSALYSAILNKINGEVAELEAKEVLLVNNPTYITSKDHDHANHIEELNEAGASASRFALTVNELFLSLIHI